MTAATPGGYNVVLTHSGNPLADMVMPGLGGDPEHQGTRHQDARVFPQSGGDEP